MTITTARDMLDALKQFVEANKEDSWGPTARYPNESARLVLNVLSAIRGPDYTYPTPQVVIEIKKRYTGAIRQFLFGNLAAYWSNNSSGVALGTLAFIEREIWRAGLTTHYGSHVVRAVAALRKIYGPNAI